MRKYLDRDLTPKKGNLNTTLKACSSPKCLKQVSLAQHGRAIATRQRIFDVHQLAEGTRLLVHFRRVFATSIPSTPSTDSDFRMLNSESVDGAEAVEGSRKEDSWVRPSTHPQTAGRLVSSLGDCSNGVAWRGSGLHILTATGHGRLKSGPGK